MGGMVSATSSAQDRDNAAESADSQAAT